MMIVNKCVYNYLRLLKGDHAMEEKPNTVDRNLEQFLSDFRRDRISNSQLEEARMWYKRFTGKEYTSDTSELIEIYRSLKETA